MRGLAFVAIHKTAGVASFGVRVVGPRKMEYTYKKHGQDKSGVRMGAWLVSSDPTRYCRAMVKGDAAKINAAMAKFQEGSAWLLSGIALDKTDQKWNSASIKFTVLLSQPTRAEALPEDAAEKMATEVAPPASVADVIHIRDKRAVDIMGVASEFAESEVSTAQGTRRKCTFTLRDDTKSIISVTIWRPSGDKQDLASQLNGKAVRIFGLSTSFYQDVLQLTTLSDFQIYPAGTTERAKALESGQDTLLNMAAGELTTLTGVPSLSTEGEAGMIVCSMLQALGGARMGDDVLVSWQKIWRALSRFHVQIVISQVLDSAGIDENNGAA